MKNELVSNTVLQRRKGGWSTKDILVTGMIGVVFAFVLVGIIYAYYTLSSIFGPVYARIINGVWIIPGLMALYLIRKPGAGLIALLITGFVMIPFTPYGWMIVLWQGMSGLICEIPFLFVLYKKYSTLFLMIGGAVVGVLSTLIEYPVYGLAAMSVESQVIMFIVSLVSGLLGGLLSKLLADAVMKTGMFAEYEKAK